MDTSSVTWPRTMSSASNMSEATEGSDDEGFGVENETDDMEYVARHGMRRGGGGGVNSVGAMGDEDRTVRVYLMDGTFQCSTVYDSTMTAGNLVREATGLTDSGLPLPLALFEVERDVAHGLGALGVQYPTRGNETYSDEAKHAGIKINEGEPKPTKTKPKPKDAN